MELTTPKPSLEELKEFATLPEVRCFSCGKITGRIETQQKFQQILLGKRQTYFEVFNQVFQQLLNEGTDEITAQQVAAQEASLAADLEFDRKLRDLGFPKYCCRRTLLAPAILPLGSGIELDPEVVIGEKPAAKVSRKNLPPVLASMQGVTQLQPQQIRQFRAI